VAFARHVSLTMLLRIAFVPLALVQAAIVLRWLGPDGQGLFAATGSWIGAAGMLGTLGLPAAVTAFAAADPKITAALLANARFTGLIAGAATILLLASIGFALPAALGPVPLSLLLLCAISLPFSLASAQFQGLLLGRRRVRDFNYMDVFDRLALLAGTLLLLPGLGRGVRALIALTVALALARYLAYHVMLQPDARRFTPDLPLLRRMAKFSVKAYVASLLSFLVLRSDIVLVSAMLGARATGLYSLSVQAADFLLILPGVIGTLLFPRVAAAHDEESAHFTAKVCRHAAFAVGLACLATAAGSFWAIRLLFGPAYLGSAAPLLALLPGVWCMAVQLVLSNDLAGRDYPAFIITVWSVVLAVNVALNVVWIPRFGITGAAASSSVAYALALALMTRYWLRRFPAVRLRDLLVVRAGELREIPARVRAAALGGEAAAS
jgi:O-antigen/teichoic acid export membrane protein